MAQVLTGHLHSCPTRRTSGGEPTPGAVPAHPEEREGEIAAHAEADRGRVAELSEQQEEFERGRGGPDHRRLLLALPGPPSRLPRSFRTDPTAMTCCCRAMAAVIYSKQVQLA
ncbi:hypothetical protein AB0N07_05375 [Streptomyces sp. NPDC051172]|uniref:hypothetical protein n=1 Tax=Streptomyces sp. NPDC051172 TaxID=3155796 RepID=UPI00341809A5